MNYKVIELTGVTDQGFDFFYFDIREIKNQQNIGFAGFWKVF
jgi:hypothetical protein